MDTHKFDVRELAKEVQSFSERGRAFRIHHGATHSFRAMHDPRAVIHTTHLHHILDINPRSRFALVEPNVTMENLAKETLKHGLIPPVVPSFPGTTVVGNFAGTAGSSASFKHGFFDKSVLWLEVVLCDGTITRASRTRNSDLFHGMVGSLGTLGVITLLQIQLVSTVKWIELSYEPVQSSEEALSTLEECAQDSGVDFVEAIIYGPRADVFGMIVAGKLRDKDEHHTATFSGPNNDWFYQHVLKVGPTTQSISIMDYLFRHNRGSFSLGEQCFGRVTANNWTRWATDTATRSDALAQIIQSLHWADHLIIQDLVVPLRTAPKMLEFIENDLHIYPVLMYPIRQWADEPSAMRPNVKQTQLSMNITLRGYTESTISNSAAFKEKHLEMEKLLHNLGGFKWLYSRNYYTEELFWETYAESQHKMLRDKYKAGYLQDVWKKCAAPERKAISPKPKGLWNRVFKWTGVVAVKHAHAQDQS